MLEVAVRVNRRELVLTVEISNVGGDAQTGEYAAEVLGGSFRRATFTARRDLGAGHVLLCALHALGAAECEL